MKLHERQYTLGIREMRWNVVRYDHGYAAACLRSEPLFLVESTTSCTGASHDDFLPRPYLDGLETTG